MRIFGLTIQRTRRGVVIDGHELPPTERMLIDFRDRVRPGDRHGLAVRASAYLTQGYTAKTAWRMTFAEYFAQRATAHASHDTYGGTR